MKLRTDTRVLAGALFASLGIFPTACGGQSLRDGGDGSSGGDGGGGDTGGSGGITGGAGNSTGGGDPSTGGIAPTGGTGNVGGTSIPTGGVGGTVPVNQYPCENPTEIGAGTSGFVRCENGVKRRRSIETCYVAVPRPDRLPEVMGATCSSDGDCQDPIYGPYGHCAMATIVGEVAPRHCSTGCASDADCDDGWICECGDFVGRCMIASCTSDADCTPGFFCQTHDRLPGCSILGYACQRPGDACGSDADCNAASKCSAGDHGDRERTCSPMTCISGRPFLVDGALRTAPATERSDWLAGNAWPDAASLSRPSRERAGDSYAECAALEHASVASFARFTLGLLAVAAPAELVAESVRAMADEIEHARVTFDLASHFLGRRVGPGALSTEGALDDSSTLDELALATFVEGCVGETLGAVEAREAAAHAVDPVLRAALERIADDEARHAALAFRFVAWALERSPTTLVRKLRAALESVRVAESRRDPGDDDGGELERYGVLTAEHRHAVRRHGFAEVVGPCTSALLEHAPGRRFAGSTLQGPTKQ
jgi:hypothetical protein